MWWLSGMRLLHLALAAAVYGMPLCPEAGAMRSYESLKRAGLAALRRGDVGTGEDCYRGAARLYFRSIMALSFRATAPVVTKTGASGYHSGRKGISKPVAPPRFWSGPTARAAVAASYKVQLSNQHV